MLTSNTPPTVGIKQHLRQREHIMLRICQALIVVIVLQSGKLVAASIYYPFALNSQSLQYHVLNMLMHLSCFFIVLILLKKKAVTGAKIILLLGFLSYILTACYLWHYDVNLQYYFLLSMFICCYIFDRYEMPALVAAITLCLSAFFFTQSPQIVSAHDTNLTLRQAKGEIEYLSSIAQINAFVFALACLICALFIRRILANNWQQLQHYEQTQSRILSKLFPPELVPPLLMSFNGAQKSQLDKTATPDTINKMQSSFSMGVIFVDVVDFTQLVCQSKTAPLHWKSIYSLFSAFDEAISTFDVKRIKTNGDQYIVLLGFQSRGVEHKSIVKQMIEVASALHYVSALDLRIGVAFGPVTCGVFDHNNPNFDIWGETVIRAARLEKLARATQILVDEATFSLSPRGTTFAKAQKYSLKGLGEQNVYALQSEKLKT